MFIAAFLIIAMNYWFTQQHIWISEIFFRAREARHMNVPSDAICKKVQEESGLRYGDRNQVSGFWVLWLTGKRQKGTF